MTTTVTKAKATPRVIGDTVAKVAEPSALAKAQAAERTAREADEALQTVVRAGSFDPEHVPVTVLQAWRNLRDTAAKAEQEAILQAERAESLQAQAEGLWQARARFLAGVHVAMGYASIAKVSKALTIGTAPTDPTGETVRLSVAAGLLMLANPATTVSAREGQRVGLQRAQAAHKVATKALATVPTLAEAERQAIAAKALAKVAKAEKRADKDPDSVDLPAVRADAEREAQAAIREAERKAHAKALRDAASAVSKAKADAAKAAREAQAKADTAPVSVAHLQPLAQAVARIVARVERSGWESPEVQREAAKIIRDAVRSLNPPKAKAKAETA